MGELYIERKEVSQILRKRSSSWRKEIMASVIR